MIEKSDAKTLAPTVWHRREQTLSLGCANCPDIDICGGQQIKASILSCMDFCCGKPNGCTIVCPRSPDFAKRVHEVHGFGLMDIEKRKRLPFPKIPPVVPIIYRSLPLLQPVDADIVAIPFNEVYRRRGKRAIPLSRVAVNNKFRLSPETKLVLSGVENDCHIEQWWGSEGKADVLGALREMDVLFATVPNFSLAADVPRHANMHSLKRIALTWAELHDAGIPTAVHANCRTDRDFVRFAEFVKFHDEIEALAFEYTTGTANLECGKYYTSLLCELADCIARPIKLILRGGIWWSTTLSRHYESVAIMDSTACMRTINRKRAMLVNGSKLRWANNPTGKGEPVDDLLTHNMRIVATRTREYQPDREAAPPRARKSTRQLEAHHESLQGSLL